MYSTRIVKAPEISQSPFRWVRDAVIVGFGDRLNRRRGLILGCLASFALLVMALNLAAGFAVAAALAVGVGLVSRTPIPLTDTLATAHLPDAASQYGRVCVCGSLGYVLTLLGIRALGVVDEQSSTSMAAVMIVPAVLTMATALALPGRSSAASSPSIAGGPLRAFNGVFWLFLLAAAMHHVGITSHYSFFSLYLHDVLDMKQAGWVWAIGSIFELPVIFFAGRILRATGLAAALIAATAAVSVRLAIYALAPTLPAVLAAQALHALTFGLHHVAAIELVRRQVPPERRGLAMALYMSVGIGLPSLIGSAAGGAVVERFGYTVLYLAYAIPPVIGIGCLAAVARRLPKSRLDNASE